MRERLRKLIIRLSPILLESMNISELASQLEISVTTVSRVLSGTAAKYRISQTTSDRVLKAADRYDVRPDALGAGLRKGKLGLIGLLLPDITNPFFSSLARAIERELRDVGLAVLLGDSNEDVDTERDKLSVMLARRLDGLILVPVGAGSVELEKVVNNGSTPVVMVDRIIPGLEVPSVCLDNFSAGRMAVKHLLEAGHRKIGCLRGEPGSFADTERLRGFTAALEEYGVSVNKEIIRGSGYSRESGRSSARFILDQIRRPSALVTLCGQGILSLLEVASEMDVQLPDDLSVVAFDEQPWSSFLKPPLTTIVQPIDELAKQVVSLLLIEVRVVNRSAPRITLQAELRERSSVRCIEH